MKWTELCRLAAKEQDPEKLMALVEEINRLLEEKEQWLKKAQPSPQGKTNSAKIPPP